MFSLYGQAFYWFIPNDMDFFMFVCFQCLKCTSLYSLQDWNGRKKNIWDKFYIQNLVATIAN